MAGVTKRRARSWPVLARKLCGVSFPMSADLSGEITAIATAVLADFAIIMAWYARRAFLKQSQEVRDQAEILRIQNGQLAEQRKINERQIKVL